MKLAITISLLILLGIILFSCKKKQGLASSMAETSAINAEQSTSNAEEGVDPAVGDEVEVAEKAIEASVKTPVVKVGYEAITDPFTIKSASIVDQALVIDISYSGGCKEHGFELLTDGMLMKSLPPKQTFYLKHTANADFCKKMIHETLRYDLREIKAGSSKELKVLLSGYKDELTLKIN